MLGYSYILILFCIFDGCFLNISSLIIQVEAPVSVRQGTFLRHSILKQQTMGKFVELLKLQH